MSQYVDLFVFTEHNIHGTTELMKPCEYEFCKLMKNAIVPFEHMFRLQNHKFTNTIISIFKQLRDSIGKSHMLYDGLTGYLSSVMANSSPYDRRSCVKINIRKYIDGITKDLLVDLFDEHMIEYDRDVVEFIFGDVGQSCYTDNSIDGSHNNYYCDAFTDADYEILKGEGKTGGINSYYSKQNGVLCVNKFCIGDMFSEQLEKVVKLLSECVSCLRKYPETFDSFMSSSMEHLIRYFETGDEEHYRKHCIDLVRTTSRVHYTMGFVSTYGDPKGIIGSAGAEVTFCPYDVSRLNPVLLELESRLPIKTEYRRDTIHATPNVSVVRRIFGAGDYGQLYQTAGYCLPTYSDIRAMYGSKQIIYSTNPPDIVSQEILDTFTTTSRKDFIRKYGNRKIQDDLWDLQVLLHETIGHASGRFADGVDDSVFDRNFVGDKMSIEELRAEIIALYLEVVETEMLEKNDMFNGWFQILGITELKKQCIINMCRITLQQFRGQKPNFEHIEGAHMRADVVILCWLLKHECIELCKEEIMYNGEKYTLYDVNVIDLEKSIGKITDLVCMVQEIKSNADSFRSVELFDMYTTSPISISEANEIRNSAIKNRLVTMNGVVARSSLFLKLDGSGDVYSDIFEQENAYCS